MTQHDDTPFTVLHVCLGNICRSPMAERLLVARFAERLTALSPNADPAVLLRSVSAGTGDWHVGNPMTKGAAVQLALRGASAVGFRARTLWQCRLVEADLILTASQGQQLQIAHVEPDVAGRTFSLLHFGRLARQVWPGLPSVGNDTATASTVRHRGQALIAAVSAVATQQHPTAADDVADPYGCADEVFSRVADDIDHALEPLVAVLAGSPPR